MLGTRACSHAQNMQPKRHHSVHTHAPASGRHKTVATRSDKTLLKHGNLRTAVCTRKAMSLLKSGLLCDERADCGC